MNPQSLKLYIRSSAVIILICCLNTSCSESYPGMVKVKGGTFTMGSDNDGYYERPPHSVTLSSFKIGKFEVTVAQYKAFCLATGHQMPKAPNWGWNDVYPMINVSYDDATAYCNWLSGVYDSNYRLPTEAEWEYAARGGKKSKGFKYSGSNDLNEIAWYDDNCGDQIEPVGRKSPNELGLYDMSGNAWEWCLDWSDGYSEAPQTNPKGPAEGQIRVLRSGSCFNVGNYCSVTYRYYDVPFERNTDFGFRVVCSPLSAIGN